MGDKDFDNFNLQIGEIIGNTLDGKDIYKFTELGTAENVMFWEPIFKDGDFVVNEVGSILIFKKKVGDFIYDHAFLAGGEMITNPNASSISGIKRYATEEEKQKLLDALAEEGKRWNAENLCVEDIPSYKKGDFLVKEYKDGVQYIFILDYIDDKGLIYYHCYHGNRFNTTCVKDDFGIGAIGDSRHKRLRYATDSEKELLIAELSKVGKRWNAEKKCVENIPKCKFKRGDKVRIKHGVSSKTHRHIFPSFMGGMDELIEKELTVDVCANGIVCIEESGYNLHEDWLEPYEELRKGDLAIFWNDDKRCAKIGIYLHRGVYYYDHSGISWMHALKFESKEQFEKLIKGEL